MNNDPKKAHDSLEALEAKIRPLLPPGLDVDFQLAYNHLEGAMPKLLEDVINLPQWGEVATEKGMDVWKTFWGYLSGLEPVPDWFQSTAKDIVSATATANYVFDEDLQKQVAAYQAEIAKGNKVIVVSHSQGNFYANAAYELLNSASFGIVAIATPSNYVAGGGPWVTLQNDHYMSNEWVDWLDGFLNLAANASPNNTDRDLGGTKHDFVSSYLEGDLSGPMIVGNINSMIDRLPSPPPSSEGEGDSDSCKAEEPEANDGEEPTTEESTEPAQPTDEETGEGEGDEGSDEEELETIDRYVSFFCASSFAVGEAVGTGTLKIDGVQVFDSAMNDCTDRVIRNLAVGQPEFTIAITGDDPDFCFNYYYDPERCLEFGGATPDGDVICSRYADEAYALEQCQGRTGATCMLMSFDYSGLDVGSSEEGFLSSVSHEGNLGSTQSFAGRNDGSYGAPNNNGETEQEIIADIIANSPECVVDMTTRIIPLTP